MTISYNILVHLLRVISQQNCCHLAAIYGHSQHIHKIIQTSIALVVRNEPGNITHLEEVCSYVLPTSMKTYEIKLFAGEYRIKSL